MVRDEKYTKISKKMKFERPTTNVQLIPEDDFINHNDLFQANYGGNPISRNKIDRNIKRIKNFQMMDKVSNIEKLKEKPTMGESVRNKKIEAFCNKYVDRTLSKES